MKNKKGIELDQIDVDILNILQEDSTISVKEIASRIKLSFTPTYERIKYLEDNKIIQQYAAIIDRELVGLELAVYCNIVLKEQSKTSLMDFEAAVSARPEILEVISISGTYDYMLKIVAKNISDYNDFIVNVIANIPNVGQYHSNFVMKEVKRATAYKVVL